MNRTRYTLALAALASVISAPAFGQATGGLNAEKVKQQVLSHAAAIDALDTRSPGEIAADEAAAAADADAAQAAADTAAQAADAALDQADDEIRANGGTVVYSWTRDGVRHYTSKRPKGVESRRIPIANLKALAASNEAAKPAARWREFYADDKSTSYIDKQTLAKDLQDQVAWTMRSYSTPETIAGFKGVASIKAQSRYDCRRRTIKTVQMLYYSPDGTVLNVENFPSFVQARPVAPESIGEIELDAVCTLTAAVAS